MIRGTLRMRCPRCGKRVLPEGRRWCRQLVCDDCSPEGWDWDDDRLRAAGMTRPQPVFLEDKCLQ